MNGNMPQRGLGNAISQNKYEDVYSMDNLKKFFQETDVKDCLKTFFGTEPRKRAKTPPIRIGNVEIHNNGMFMEKPKAFRPKDPVLCTNYNCFNQKPVINGYRQPFCSIICAKAFEANEAASSFSFNPRNRPNDAFPVLGKLSNNGCLANSEGPEKLQVLFNRNNNQKQFDGYTSSRQLFNNMTPQPSRSNPVQQPSPHQFGKVTPLDLLKYYEQTPKKATTSPNDASIYTSTFAKKNNNLDISSFTTPRRNWNVSFNNQGLMTSPTLGPRAPSPFEKCAVFSCQNKKSSSYGPQFKWCSERCMNLANTPANVIPLGC
jgi:hypothetical protein